MSRLPHAVSKSVVSFVSLQAGDAPAFMAPAAVIAAFEDCERDEWTRRNAGAAPAK